MFLKIYFRNSVGFCIFKKSNYEIDSFGKADWPLILVIIGSVLLGALLAGLIGMMKIYQLQKALKRAENNNVDDNS
ncbi:DUF1049 domain-containing protein [Bacillus sporothermodurans]|uniref:lipopolysaccharide assembly protein LapA domain-containing protein n=1 Tax=Heyndrickxia sporothermodurans TaxID=46224 RepID=UPI00192ADAE5|nr:lipopolysaccharide assembly protein LapA domain-containing protein [Heyndrickxia sporothermodurans]MBL5783302.1 DUF1049 domain-containing protein [Heyndrickxia sporothermodurans]